MGNYEWERFWEAAVGAFKYFLAGLMMLSGVLTSITPTTPISGALGFIYSSRIGLVIFGIAVFASGVTLLYGKVRKDKIWTGRGLMAIYLMLLFATIIQFVAFAGDPTAWVGNLIATIITGLLWLRWKFKTVYINPNHFKRHAKKLNNMSV